jgi:hypothetical protein
MADQLLEQVRDVVDGQIVRPSLLPVDSSPGLLLTLLAISQDFEGQKLAEILATALLSIVGVSGLLSGSMFRLFPRRQPRYTE